MHSMPAVTKSPNEKWLACQSLDNKICIFTCGEKFRPHKKKEFKGHMVAGYACTIDFSPEMRYYIFFKVFCSFENFFVELFDLPCGEVRLKLIVPDEHEFIHTLANVSS